jgi:hypothetical protein
MPTPAAVPAQLRTRPYRGTAAIAYGALTRAPLRSSPWRRLFPDVHVHEDVEITHALRVEAAARLLHLPTCTAPSNWSPGSQLVARIARALAAGVR